MLKHIVFPVAVGLAFLSITAPVEEASAATGTSQCDARAADVGEAQPRRRRGLGGLMSTLRSSGVGSLLGSGVLGDSQAAQIAGTVSSGAIAAAGEGGGRAAEVIGNIASTTGATGNGTAGAVANVVAGAAATAAARAENGASPQACAPASSGQREWRAVD